MIDDKQSCLGRSRKTMILDQTRQFFFVFGITYIYKANSYFAPYPKLLTEITNNSLLILDFSLSLTNPLLVRKKNLLYHVNRLIKIYQLCILPEVVTEIIILAYDKSYLGFTRCFEIISRLWYI